MVERLTEFMSQLPPPPVRRRARRGPALPGWMIGALLGVFALATLLAGYLVYATVRDAVSGWQITGPSGIGPILNGTPQPGASPTPGGQTLPSIVPQKWKGAERVTILLLGIDRRPGEDERGYLTDSMMLITVDPVAQTAGILSIPRDLWVEIPTFGTDSINQANRFGDAYDYPGGGPALAVKTVEYNLGVDVNYFVRLDFHAFETLVDAIGGIDIDNPTDIDDPYYPDGAYGYEPFYLPAGLQHLNGHDALRYARTRHDSSDIARADRQQQVVLAVREKVTSLDMLPALIAQAPTLYQSLNQNIKTDLTLEQIVSLALLALDVPKANVQNRVIDYRYVLDYTTPEGRQVLVPLRDKIRELRDELFALPTVIAPPSEAELNKLMQAEGATVEVLNGAGVEGLARATADWLATQGVTIINVDTADTITLDANTLFKTIGGANQALDPSDAVLVCSNGTNWYQIGAVSANQ